MPFTVFPGICHGPVSWDPSVRWRGLEPPTPGLGNQCSIRLSYQRNAVIRVWVFVMTLTA
jgi:hypothetical protein